MEFIETERLLKIWGERLKRARIARNDTMKIFGVRIGVS